MIILLSPAKSLNFELNPLPTKPTTPFFTKETETLIDHFKKLSSDELEKLMKISPKIAELNFQRFQDFSDDYTDQNSRPALFFFDGDVYKSMTADQYDTKDLQFAQNHLRIISGLYGILRALDLIQPYRLEMGTNSKKIIGNNLPEFWQEKIANFLNDDLEKQREKTIINLASEEYFSAVNPQKTNGRIINIIFKENKNDIHKVIGIFAKRARGLMADFIIKNKIEKSGNLKEFDSGNYQFQPKFSDENNWHFYR